MAKKRLLYNRDQHYDENVDTIMAKDPHEMTDNEKVIWKVEILKESENMDD